MRFEISSEVEPAVAFQRVADFGRLAEWDPAVASVLSDGPLAVGTRLTLKSSRGLGGLVLRYQVMELEIPSHVVYRGGTRRVTTVDSIGVEPGKVTVESRMQFSGWSRLIAPLVRLGVWLGGRYLSVPAMRRRLQDT